MKETFMVSREDQLLALLHPVYGFHLLGQFVEPCTASEAARNMGDAANKVSYHVGRLQELGLLVPGQVDSGRGRPLRAVARRFTLSPALFPLLGNELIRPMLQSLTDSFLAAGAVPEPDAREEYVLMDWHPKTRAPEMQQPDWRQDGRGVNVQQFHLSRERYAALMQDLQERITQEVRASQEAGEGKWHTVALIGFPGTMLPMAERAK